MKGQPRNSRREGPGTLQWGAEYAFLSSSGVSGKLTVSISDRRGKGLGAGEGALDMGVSHTNFHPDSECQLRGPASPASPHCRPPLLTPRQDCLLRPRLTLPCCSVISGDRLPRRTGALWVLEHWPRGPLRGSYHSSQGGLSSLKVLTACPCLSSRCPPCPLSCPHSHLQLLTCCHHASEAQEQVTCPWEMPPGPGGTLRRPRPVLLQPQRSSAPPPPLLPLRVLPRAPLLAITRIFMEPWPLALLMHGLHVQHLMKVYRAPRRKVQVPPRKPLPLRALTKILWPGRPGYWWSSCWRSTPRSSPSRRMP